MVQSYPLPDNRALYIITPSNTEILNLKIAALIAESMEKSETPFEATIWEVRNFRAPQGADDA